MDASVLEADWPVVRQPAEPGIGWTGYQVSPWLPLAWPPAVGSGLRQYVYAYGQRLDRPIVDGQLISHPWAQVEQVLGAAQPSARVMLPGGLRSLGIQGVRPLSAAERAASRPVDLEGAFNQWALRWPPEPPLADEVRRIYRQWLTLNGVIAGCLRPQHPAFFNWIEGQAG